MTEKQGHKFDAELDMRILSLLHLLKKFLNKKTIDCQIQNMVFNDSLQIDELEYISLCIAEADKSYKGISLI
jgi:nitrate/nitrite-specific signal transduction histidine kinase